MLVAFNVILFDIDMVGARALARSIRESSAGLRGVQALAFELPGSRVQLSMNLFRIDETSPSDAIAELARRGVAMGAEQVVGLCPAIAANPAADGRLLEGRLASAAASAVATRCEERGGEELAALARRLRKEADELARLPVDQDAILAGAERAAALIQVLEAAHVLDVELAGLLRAAARGLLQFIITTARDIGREVGLVDVTPEDLYDPRVIIRLGAKYVATLSKRFDANRYKAACAAAVAAFAAGPVNCEEAMNA